MRIKVSIIAIALTLLTSLDVAAWGGLGHRTIAEIAEIAAFASSLPHVSEIHLLPYHNMGRDKYTGLNREYAMGDVKSPTNELMEVLKQTAQQFGLNVQIGG